MPHQSHVYCIVGKEEAPTTHTVHAQGFIYSKNKLSWTWVRSILDTGAHVESIKGSPAQNIAYCMKEGEWTELNPENKPVCQGKRTDLVDILDAVESNRFTLRSAIRAGVVRSYMGCRVWDRVSQAIPARKRDEVRVGWFHGVTGAGKSHTVSRLAETITTAEDIYTFSNAHGWWAGYDGQRVVIIEDATPTNPPIDELLRALDKYPLSVGGKGHCCRFCGIRVFVTSHFDPMDVGGMRASELIRRLSSTTAGMSSADRAYVFEFSTRTVATECVIDKPIPYDYYALPPGIQEEVPAEVSEEEGVSSSISSSLPSTLEEGAGAISPL